MTIKQAQEIKKLTGYVILNYLMFIVLGGAIINIGVLAYNDGKMPVHFYDDEFIPQMDEFHISFHDFDEVKYPWLSDIITIPIIKYRASFGDLVMFTAIGLIGIFMFRNRKGLK